ncbi:protein of unknown function [Paraburkholderia kururiensis]
MREADLERPSSPSGVSPHFDVAMFRRFLGTLRAHAVFSPLAALCRATAQTVERERRPARQILCTNIPLPSEPT